ncbi:hypothetical protein EV195_104169 [Tenacibaculum skagerrakense]|uniref:Uncharacterized protein n=1 Tax=Tenacibaculum skagerrakense TaxID=186571 RepID=A0A4V2SLY0_9FLAO|nr:hypothetical protein [Tenacibaculum skagerrakense]TCP25136.1 hypothetical protein EV195_104169 [Tenacibaculum skagerrakense]
MKYYVKNDRELFSQLNLESGEKILISITDSEVAILKLGFLSIPVKKIWFTPKKSFISKFNITEYPSFGLSKNKSIIDKIKEIISLDDCKKLSDISVALDT